MSKIKTDYWNKMMACILAVSGVLGVYMFYHWSRCFYATVVVSAVLIFIGNKYAWIPQVCMAVIQAGILVRYFLYKGNSVPVVLNYILMLLTLAIILVWMWRRTSAELNDTVKISNISKVVIIMVIISLIELAVLQLWYYKTWGMGIIWLGERAVLYFCLLAPYAGIAFKDMHKQ